MCSYSSEWEWNTQGPSQTLRDIYMCVYTLLHVCKKGRRVFQHVCLKKMCMYVCTCVSEFGVSRENV